MSSLVVDLDRQAQLRLRALSHLSVGSRSVGGLASASAALSVLLELASSPATAADALALLHELQVHQVELEIQEEELRSSRDDIELALSRQVALFEHAPVGYLALDAQIVVRDINLRGARLLGAERKDVLGQALIGFLPPGSVDQLHTLLARARQGHVDERCALRLRPHDGVQCVVHATAGTDPVSGHVLVALIEPGLLA
jgi:PAS domain S-box-containing protein